MRPDCISAEERLSAKEQESKNRGAWRLIPSLDITAVLEELNRQVTQLIGTMNASIDNAFAGCDRQRDELQRYVTREREALVEQLRQTGDDLVRTTLDAVPGLVGKVLLYLVLALAVLIGGPFALGFWLGGVRQRAKSRIKDEELKMKN